MVFSQRGSFCNFTTDFLGGFLQYVLQFVKQLLKSMIEYVFSSPEPKAHR